MYIVLIKRPSPSEDVNVNNWTDAKRGDQRPQLPGQASQRLLDTGQLCQIQEHRERGR